MEQEFLIPKEQIDKMTKRVLLFRTLMILASCLFVAFIPLIVGCATYRIWAGVIVFAVLTGLLFYAIPIGWGMYALFERKKRFFMLIVNNQLTQVDEIASATGKRPRTVIRQLRSLIKGGYLIGWKFNIKTNEIIPTQTLMTKCPHCSGPIRPTEKICTYCNGTIRK